MPQWWMTVCGEETSWDETKYRNWWQLIEKRGKWCKLVDTFDLCACGSETWWNMSFSFIFRDWSMAFFTWHVTGYFCIITVANITYSCQYYIVCLKTIDPNEWKLYFILHDQFCALVGFEPLVSCWSYGSPPSGPGGLHLVGTGFNRSTNWNSFGSTTVMSVRYWVWTQKKRSAWKVRHFLFQRIANTLWCAESVGMYGIYGISIRDVRHPTLSFSTAWTSGYSSLLLAKHPSSHQPKGLQ